MKMVVFFITFFACTQAIFAQVKPPENVNKNFSTAYPNLPNQNVNWVLENGNYRGEFLTFDSTRTSVMYDRNGKLMETQMDIKDTDLPMSARESLKGKKPNRIMKITDSNGVVTYGTTIDDMRMIFDDKGKQQQMPPRGGN
jgi:hypothetical protein